MHGLPDLTVSGTPDEILQTGTEKPVSGSPKRSRLPQALGEMDDVDLAGLLRAGRSYKAMYMYLLMFRMSDGGLVSRHT